MSSQTHYALLNLDSSATESEILSSFRKLSLKCHPDKGGDAEEFCKLTAAKEFCIARLTNPNHGEEPSTPVKTADDIMTELFGGMKHEDLSEEDLRPFVYERSPSSKLKSFMSVLGRKRKASKAAKEDKKEQKRARKHAADAQAYEDDIMAQAMRFTQMQSAARAQGIKC